MKKKIFVVLILYIFQIFIILLPFSVLSEEKNNIAISFKPLCNVKNIDLDGDGIDEKINVVTEKYIDVNSKYPHSFYTIYINNIKILEKIKDYPNYYVIDIDVKDKYKEIVLDKRSEVYDYVTELYYYNGNKVIKMGEITGGLILDATSIDGSGIIRKNIMSHVLTAKPICCIYRLTPDHLIFFDKFREDLYELNYIVKVKESIVLQKNKTDIKNTIILKQGETVKILATDNKEWVLVENSEDIEGWFTVEDFYKIKGTGKIADEFFDGLYKENEKVDLNGDGKLDVVCFKDEGNCTVKIYVNYTSQMEGGPAYITDIVDIDERDNIKEITVGDSGPSDDYSTRFYYYNGKDIVYMGTVGGTLENGITINSDGKVIARERGKILHTWFYTKIYRLNKNHLLGGVPQQNIYKMNYKVKLKIELPLQKSQIDRSVVTILKPGEEVTIVASDDKEWCLLENSKGIRGWFAVEKFSTIKGINKNAYDVFEGLCGAD